jgi:NADPH:quinone reductase-like Zn-dependent oxidoreductase
MRAIRVHQYGSADQLTLEQIARPAPRDGEVLVRVRAAGVLPAEWKMRQGFFKSIFPASFPYTPGSAFAGVVAEAGAGVAGFAPGQAVFGRTNSGAYAEYTTVAPATLARKPDSVTFEETATISGGATVAWIALLDNGGLRPGQRVLVHGAAGGVGLFAVQIARLHGAHVIGTASAGNLDFVRALGAEQAINYAAGPFEEAVQDVDLVLDTIGGATLRRSFTVVRPGGTIVSLLEPPPQDLAQQRGIRAIQNSVTQPFPSAKLLETIAELLASRQLRTLVGAALPLAEARQAHLLSETGHGRGRIVLDVD